MPRTACITGLGFVSCLGNDSATVADALRSGRSGIAAHALTDNPAVPVKVAAPVRGLGVCTTVMGVPSIVRQPLSWASLAVNASV